MTALATLLADPSRAISYVVELVERDPETDTETTRRYQTPNRTASDGLPPLLADPGGRNDKLEVDELAAIAAQTVEPIKLSNQPASVGAAGPLDFLRERSLSGRAITIYAGAVEEAFANYEAVASGVVDREPVFDGNVVEIRIKSPLERLNVDLDVGTYVGEPGALRGITSSTTPKAATASTAAFSLPRYTLAIRIYSPGISSDQAITRRQISASNRNWRLAWTAGGSVYLLWTVGGVSKQLVGTSVLDDGRWHTIVVGVGGSALTSYLMIDGVVEATLNAGGQADTGTTNVEMLTTVESWRMCDFRIFNHYIAPDEMRAVMAVRADGGEVGLVGLWRGDDNTGSTLTDYSSTGAHATVSGTEGVAFEWVSSDLGTREQAGKSMQAVIGTAFNVGADLVDPERERWRFSDEDLVLNVAGTDAADTWSRRFVRDQGEELSLSTDVVWTNGEPAFELVSPAGEPVTVDVRHHSHSIQHTLYDLLARRGPLARADLDSVRLAAAVSDNSGVVTRRAKIPAVLTPFLSGMLAALFPRRDGRVAFDYLMPPFAPSPRDGACLSMHGVTNFYGAAPAKVTWVSPSGALSGRNFTLVCWLKSAVASEQGDGYGNRNLIDLAGGGSTAGLSWTLSFGSNTMGTMLAPRMFLQHFPSFALAISAALPAMSGMRPAAEWYFLALTHDNAGNVTRFYAAPNGTALTLQGSTTGLGLASTPTTSGVIVGSAGSTEFAGSVFEPQVWDGVLSLAQLQALMNAAPVGNESSLAFYAPLNGSATVAVTDTVASATGTITGDVREVPDLVLDLDLSPTAYADRALRPARRIDVLQRPNHRPLDDADFAPAVTSRQRRETGGEGEWIPWPSPEIAADYIDARDISLRTPWCADGGYNETNPVVPTVGGSGTQRLARVRFAPGKLLAEVKGVGGGNRAALLLELLDEVRVYGSRWGLDTGPVYRVASNHARLAELTCDLELWR